MHSSTGETRVVEYASTDIDRFIEQLIEAAPKGKGTCLLLLGEREFEKLKFAHSVARVTGHQLHVIPTPALAGDHLAETHANLSAEFEKIRVSPTVLFFSEVETLLRREGISESDLDRIRKELAFLCKRAQSFPGFTLLSLDTHKHIDEDVLKRAVEVIVAF